MSCTEIDAYRGASSAIKKFVGNYINMESSIIECKFRGIIGKNLLPKIPQFQRKSRKQFYIFQSSFM